MMNKKVLVCDDDEGILDVISLVLHINGFEAITEQHSVNIFQRIEEIKPDVILLDLWMPYLNGEEITYTLKHNPITRNIPVIIISASRDGKEIANSLAADDFISKPFDVFELVKRVKSFLRE